MLKQFVGLLITKNCKARKHKNISRTFGFLVLLTICLYIYSYTFFLLRNLKQEQSQIRLNLVVAIAIAQIIFLAGIDATTRKVRMINKATRANMMRCYSSFLSFFNKTDQNRVKTEDSFGSLNTRQLTIQLKGATGYSLFRKIQKKNRNTGLLPFLNLFLVTIFSDYCKHNFMFCPLPICRKCPFQGFLCLFVF